MTSTQIAPGIVAYLVPDSKKWIIYDKTQGRISLSTYSTAEGARIQYHSNLVRFQKVGDARISVAVLFTIYPLSVVQIAEVAGFAHHTKLSNWIGGVSQPRNPAELSRINRYVNQIGKELATVKLSLPTKRDRSKTQPAPHKQSK
jgi:hypothetical protein